MRAMLLAVVIAFGLAGLPAAVFADPAIMGLEGTLGQGQQITLMGADFGNKAQAAPFRWDNFQNGTPGQYLVDRNSAGGGVWDLQGDISRWPLYSTGRQRVPGDVCALQDFPGTAPNGPSSNKAIAVIDEPSRVWYVSYWGYQDDYMGTARNTDNSKIYGVFAGAGWMSSYPDIRWEDQPVNSSGTIWAIDGTGQWPAGLVYQQWIGYTDVRNRWARIELYLDMGDPGVANGYHAGYCDLKLRGGQTGMFTPAGLPNTVGSYMQAEYWRVLNDAALRHYISEMYVDHSFARVEIGDASTWAACTHREIQIPSAWAPGEITVTGNIGTFAPGSQVYLFVVDENRKTSTGYPVVIGQTENAEIPGIPGTPVRSD